MKKRPKTKGQTYSQALWYNKQRIRIRNYDRLLPFLGKRLDAARNGRLPTVDDLCRRRPQHKEGSCGRRLAVVDAEVGSYGFLAGEGGEAAPCQTFIQQGREDAAVHDARVAREVCAQVEHGRQALAALLAPDIRRHWDFIGPRKGPRSEIGGAHLGRNRQMWSGFREA